MLSLIHISFAYMLNGYMLYDTMRSQLTEAVEYANTMESARSILRVADGELSTFEQRFAAMARGVRQVGIETKFTAVEVGGAVKYLAMAGQGIEPVSYTHLWSCDRFPQRIIYRQRILVRRISIMEQRLKSVRQNMR